MSEWDLKITQEQFSSIYGDLVSPELFLTSPSTEESLVVNFLTSKLWRLNRLYTIVDKDGQRVPFRMNYAQHIVYRASLAHPRVIILKSRQQGISTFWLISFLDDALIYQDMNVGLMAQGKAEARTLLKRVGMAWGEFPKQLKTFLSLRLSCDNTEEQGFTNGSTLFIRTSFRSTTLQCLHISEFGKIANMYPARAQETKTGTLQAIKPGNTVAIESTAEGENEFKRMWDAAVLTETKIAKGLKLDYSGKDFKPVFLSWLNDPDCVEPQYEEPSLNDQEYFEEIEALTGHTLTTEQKNFWLVQRRELGDAIYQEYPATPAEAFAKVNDGSYYGTAFAISVEKRGRIVANLYDENLPVHVALDLGMNDTFSLTYFQCWGDEWRIVNEYSNSGEGLEFYVNKIADTGYDIGYLICPHDIKVRELGSGKTRLSRLRELGVRRITVLERSPILDGIEAVRKMIPNLWVDERCVETIGTFHNYSKEWDDKYNVWKTKPCHDKWSHVADSIRAMALSKVSRSKLIHGKTRETSGVVDGMSF